MKGKMKPKIIFDLSEVLILGLVGVEKYLSPILDFPENEILQCFGGKLLENICQGKISEDVYLEQIVENQKWQIQIGTLKTKIRENFHQEVEGSKAILAHLVNKYEVVLLSDHAKEWVVYIKIIHPFLGVFRRTFFSYELGKTKKEPETFKEVLKKMNYKAEECWLIDDSARNIEIADSVGINGIQFNNAGQLEEELISQSIW